MSLRAGVLEERKATREHGRMHGGQFLKSERPPGSMAGCTADLLRERPQPATDPRDRHVGGAPLRRGVPSEVAAL
jgi:hypothetical protein